MMQATDQTKRICPMCGGSGKVRQKKYRRGATHTVKCYHCKGSGNADKTYSTKG